MKRITRTEKIILVIVILLALAVPITVLFNQQQQNTQSNAMRPSCPGDCGDTVITCPGTDEDLARNNITVTGVTKCPPKETVLQATQKAFSYQPLKQKIGADTLKIKNSKTKNSPLGYTQNKNIVYLYGLEGRTLHSDENPQDVWKFVADHELFHVLYLRNNDYIKSYPYTDLIQQDRNCFRNTKNGYVISTYSTTPPAGKTKTESFAESGALYIWDKSPLDPYRNTITSFRTQCPNSYNWFRNNIFN